MSESLTTFAGASVPGDFRSRPVGFRHEDADRSNSGAGNDRRRRPPQAETTSEQDLRSGDEVNGTRIFAMGADEDGRLAERSFVMDPDVGREQTINHIIAEPCVDLDLRAEGAMPIASSSVIGSSTSTLDVRISRSGPVSLTPPSCAIGFSIPGGVKRRLRMEPNRRRVHWCSATSVTHSSTASSAPTRPRPKLLRPPPQRIHVVQGPRKEILRTVGQEPLRKDQ